MEIEFRSYNPRARQQSRRGGPPPGRGGVSLSQPRDEIYRRWGYKLIVKPIFGFPKILEGNPVQISILNSLVQLTNKLSKE